MKGLGELKYFLGIEFARSGHGILMHQRKYALELISELGVSAAKPSKTPIDNSIKITTIEYDLHNPGKSVIEDTLLSDLRSYQRLVGKLLYLTVTRPDIAFSVQNLSQYIQQPKTSHTEAAQRIIRYIKNQPGLGVLLSSNPQEMVTTFCDVVWASCAHTRKSVTSFLIKIGDSLVS